VADNTVLNPGSGGDTYASDEIGGVKHQRVKMEHGPDGTATEVDDVDGKRLPVKEAKAATATRTSVNDSGTSVTILASNANRKGAVVLNTSSATLFLALGTVAASLTDYTAKVFTDQLYEIPACFTGPIQGIWDTDPNDGGARVTELT
jgi:hypothetical protein